jgi:SAM-dependent methyltransferase
VDDRLADNRANWDDRTGIHVESRFYDVEGWLGGEKQPSSRWKDDVEMLGDVSGLRLLHLQCHFGMETLSWARLGAEVTGLDFSPVAVDAARDLATRAGLADRSTFVCGNVLEAAEVLDGHVFDVVYVSLGALCWLPSIDRWASQAAALVAPGGRFYIHDVHPLTQSFDDDGTFLANSYFEEAEPMSGDWDMTYTDATRPITSTRQHEWNHGVGETASALVHHGLRIDRLDEYDWNVWQRFPCLVRGDDGLWHWPAGRPRLPQTFSILASRPPDTVRS